MVCLSTRNLNPSRWMVTTSQVALLILLLAKKENSYRVRCQDYICDWLWLSSLDMYLYIYIHSWWIHGWIDRMDRMNRLNTQFFSASPHFSGSLCWPFTMHRKAAWSTGPEAKMSNLPNGKTTPWEFRKNKRSHKRNSGSSSRSIASCNSLSLFLSSQPTWIQSF